MFEHEKNVEEEPKYSQQKTAHYAEEIRNTIQLAQDTYHGKVTATEDELKLSEALLGVLDLLKDANFRSENVEKAYAQKFGSGVSGDNLTKTRNEAIKNAKAACAAREASYAAQEVAREARQVRNGRNLNENYYNNSANKKHFKSKKPTPAPVTTKLDPAAVVETARKEAEIAKQILDMKFPSKEA